MKERFLRILLVAGCLYAGACTLNRETIVPDTDVETEEITVTFSLSTEGQMVSSRAGGIAFDEDGNKTRSTISNGADIDKVVYAVYVPEGNGYRLLKQYGDGTDGLGEGQAQLSSTENLRTNTGEQFSLRLMRGQQYVIGFWAQNSACKAYDSQDLTAVVVDYTAGNNTPALNNDEIRDAFCQVCSFEAQVGVKQHVVLRRALAQINVGTAGWDYNAEVDYGNNFAYSKIEMTGVKNKLNVLTGEVGTTADFGGAVTYDWAKLPAYLNTSYPTAFPADEDEDFAAWLKNTKHDDEFLYVKLRYDQQDWLDYNTTKPTSEENITSEVFKYLSMCYVLAPTYTGTETETETKSGLAIADLKFYLAEFVENGEGYIAGNTNDETPSKVVNPRFHLTDVPVQRNWRTNILGGTHGTETTLFNPREVTVIIAIRPGYDDDEHNYEDQTKDSVDDTKHEGDVFPETSQAE